MTDPAAPASTDAAPPTEAAMQADAQGGANPVTAFLDRHKGRFGALVALLLSGTLLAVAAGLTPDNRGFGTHESLGLGPCGFKAATDMPCATCGMTTSFTHAAEGDLIGAFAVQPAGAVFAVLTAMLAIVSALSVIYGFSLLPLMNALARPRTLLILGALLIGGWVYTGSFALAP